MATEPKYPVQTVTKAIQVINFLADHSDSRGVGITEFSNELGMGKSTVHRILDTLQYYGFIDKNEATNRYRLGWRLYQIGQIVPTQNQLFNLDQQFMVDLANLTHETVNLGTLNRNETLIISKVDGSRERLNVNMQPGEHEAVHATALGKILICEKTDDEVRAIVGTEHKFKKFTNNTIINVEDLLKELDKVRRQGYAVDDEEWCIGLYCMAMPIRDYTGEIVAAVSVSVPYARITEARCHDILGHISVISTRISNYLGYK